MTATAEFWRWMRGASDELREADGQTVADEVEQRLGQIDQRLGVEVSGPADPRELKAEIPADLAAIAMRALELRPSDRYRTAGAMAFRASGRIR